MIHTGNMNNGHYYLLYKNEKGLWFKVDDNSCKTKTVKEVYEIGTGSYNESQEQFDITNAYFLVYEKMQEIIEERAEVEDQIRPHKEKILKEN